MSNKILVGLPAGMESDDESGDNIDEFVTPTDGPQMASPNGNDSKRQLENGDKQKNGDRLNGHSDAVNGDDFGEEEAKVAPADDLEAIFDNGVPVDETVKLNNEPDQKQEFSFKAINEIIGHQENGKNGVAQIVRRVSFNERTQNIGGKRRRVENEQTYEEDAAIKWRASGKSTSYSGSRGFDAFRFKSESFAELREDLETVLLAANLGHLLPLFRNQGVGLKEFLIMNDLDFEKIGVIEMGDRKRLVQLVADVHAKPWSEKSLIEPGPNFSVAEAVKMVSNIHGHMVCMESSLYFLRHIADQKQLLPSERENFNKLLREVDATMSSVPMFQKRLRELRGSLQRTAGILVESKAAADFIDTDTKLRDKCSVLRHAGKVALIITAPLALYVIYRKVFKN